MLGECVQEVTGKGLHLDRPGAGRSLNRATLCDLGRTSIGLVPAA
jgi:hypothetical protein